MSDKKGSAIDDETRIRTKQVHLSQGDNSHADDDDDECHSIPDEEPVLLINIEDIDLNQISKSKADKLDVSRNHNDLENNVNSAPSLNDFYTIKPDRVPVAGEPELLEQLSKRSEAQERLNIAQPIGVNTLLGASR